MPSHLRPLLPLDVLCLSSGLFFLSIGLLMEWARARHRRYAVSGLISSACFVGTAANVIDIQLVAKFGLFICQLFGLYCIFLLIRHHQRSSTPTIR